MILDVENKKMGARLIELKSWFPQYVMSLYSDDADIQRNMRSQG